MLSMFSLKGKVALITGASRGIGLAFAEGLAEAGADVACLDIIPPSEGFEAIPTKYGVRTKHLICDVTKEPELAKAFEEVAAHFGKLDIAIACAGIYQCVSFLETTSETLKAIYDTNLAGVFNTAKHAAKIMVKQQEQSTGPRADYSIILVASIGSHKAIIPRESSAYCSSKGGVRAMVHAIAAELGKYGIRVNSISPGVVSSDMSRVLPESLTELWVADTLLGRIAQPEDLKGPCVFLASEASRYVTGEDLLVDGGSARV
ncbi:Mannitol 2-dehydrogenase [Cladobotryum mycophilum]|uniref:Mannitol 2-dehydrogenase n=1 Tax=Cladobotryum mycophilum TaxID=491253 RepID=A0ABR0SJ55_9HYPO